MKFGLVLAFAISSGMLYNAAPATAQIISTIAGSSNAGYSGDGGPAAAAWLNSPTCVAADAAGNFYFADAGNMVRKVNASGIITRFAGVDTLSGYSGDGGPADEARLNLVSGLAVDAAGNVYISDGNENRIRKVNTSGVITTVIGNGTGGFSGDNGPAASAQLLGPGGIAFDASGNLYIADRGNYRIRKVNTSGTITTIAGDGTFVGFGNNGDGGPATVAKLGGIAALATDPAGNLFIADDVMKIVRKINTGGIITTVASPLNSPQFGGPQALATDASGNLYIVDYDYNKVRRMTPSGNISVLAGTGNGIGGFAGDGSIATSAYLNQPSGIAVVTASASCVSVYIGDSRNNRIRKVIASKARPTVTVTPSQSNVPAGASVTLTATVTDGGTNPTYQWEIWGTSVGTNAATYTYVPSDNDKVSCKVTNTDCYDPQLAFSNEVYLSVGPATGLNEVQGGLSATLYPNPGNGNLVLSGNWFTPGDKTVTLSVYSTMGQKMHEETIAVKSGMPNQAINLAEKLAPGTYLLRVSGEKEAVLRFVVSNR